MPTVSIRFPNDVFRNLHQRLLADTRYEAFAVMLAKREAVGKIEILRVVDVRFPQPGDYQNRGKMHLRMAGDFIHRILTELTQRPDVDTLIDVHTHPFCGENVAFSGIDDADERGFLDFLHKHFDDIHYASVVLSRSDYAARRWRLLEDDYLVDPAILRTQTAPESWPRAHDTSGSVAKPDANPQWSRSIAALGVDTMRRITDRQRIAVIGAGGLGSIIAENLVHMGFPELVLVDPDTLELSNLNRVVGARHRDARKQRPKVHVLARHLQEINPAVRITPHQGYIADEAIQQALAESHWLIVATDNHLSRAQAQQFCLRTAVPMISAGVNITVQDGQILDMSGEVITTRLGDELCLNCLKRISPIEVAADSHPDTGIRQALVARGYVTGHQVVEPAVKTLNSNVANLAVDCLINQYTQRQPHHPILVYENNLIPTIYPDERSVSSRQPCYACNQDA